MLRRVGVVLMVVGLADIAFMVYCIANSISYSSSFNLFALIAGILLYRGSLAAARIGAHAAALFTGATLVGLLVAPFLVPARLALVAVRTAPTSSALAWVFALALPALSLWVYRQLTSDAVTSAMDKPLLAGRSMVAGGLLVLVIALVVSRSLRGGASEQVLAEARQRLGPDFEYFITGMTSTAGRDGESVSALVLAYNSDRIEPVAVRCEGTGASLRCASRSRASENESAEESGPPAEAAASGPAAASEPADPLAPGHDSFRKGDFRAAIAAYTTALERDPSNTDGHYWRGVSYVRVGERDLALKDFDECIARADANIDVYVQADRLLMRSREWSRIIDNWTAFIGRNPENGQAYYERSGAYHRNGDAERALRDLEESCRLEYQPGCLVLKRFSPRE